MGIRVGKRLCTLLAWGAALCLPTWAAAGCSRTINVPVAPIGLSVYAGADGAINGVFPDVLRGLSSKEGCSFEFSLVPRARLDVMFESGRADMLLPASRSPLRDQTGIFVPLIYGRATLITLASDRPALKSAQDLLEHKDLRVGVVRGFDFGAAYQSLVRELSEQGRVVQDVDALSVARLLQLGTVDYAIMAPSILAGTLQMDSKMAGLLPKLRYEPIEELPWADSGLYLSKSALSEADRNTLRDALERANKTGVVWRAFQRNYPANVLAGSLRPR